MKESGHISEHCIEESYKLEVTKAWSRVSVVLVDSNFLIGEMFRR